MNAKLCKKLRRAAEARTPGLPESRLLGKRVTNGRGFASLQAVNEVRTTRGLYRAMKRQVRNGVTR